MSFKDQLAADLTDVFFNTNEFGDVITLDGVEVVGVFEEDSNGYNETPLLYVRFAETAIVTDASKIVINGKTYGVISIKPPKYGEKIVFLGDAI